jgi:hypothetical protein
MAPKLVDDLLGSQGLKLFTLDEYLSRNIANLSTTGKEESRRVAHGPGAVVLSQDYFPKKAYAGACSRHFSGSFYKRIRNEKRRKSPAVSQSPRGTQKTPDSMCNRDNNRDGGFMELFHGPDEVY